MQALKFNLSGKTAIFKRPDVNTPYCFSYSHIHKLALLGILGAICGFEGYNGQKAYNDKCIAEKREKDILDYPEFYEKLKDIKVAIIPKEPIFATKKQNFNNSAGYALTKKGNNLVVKEQWLENPGWEIFILLDGSEVTENLKQRFLKREFVYIPYLGKNDHFADITDIEVVDLREVQNCSQISSMIYSNKVADIIESSDYRDDETSYFKYVERLPVALDEYDNQYILQKFTFTNYDLKINDYKDIYSCSGKNISFF